jgi:hypothetical protein
MQVERTLLSAVFENKILFSSVKTFYYCHHLYQLMRCRLLFFFFVLVKSSPAQFVNTESAKMQTDTAGWMGNASAAMNLTKSVERITEIDMGLHFQYKTKKNLWILLGNYNFLKGANEKYVDNRFIHLRYSFKLRRRLNWEVFTQAENNLVTQLRSRFITGTGPRVKIFSNKFIHLHVATHFTYIRERERNIKDTVHWDFRSSSYIAFVITPNDKIEFNSTTFFQPLYKKFSNNRIMNQSTLSVKASKHFSLIVRWNYLHDRFPIGTTPESLYGFSTGVNYNL